MQDEAERTAHVRTSYARGGEARPPLVRLSPRRTMSLFPGSTGRNEKLQAPRRVGKVTEPPAATLQFIKSIAHTKRMHEQRGQFTPAASDACSD